MVLLALLAAGGRVQAACVCEGGDVELALVLDVSGSMNQTLATLQEQAQRMVEALAGQMRSVRVGVVVYRTKQYVGSLKKLEVLPFTTDQRLVGDFLRAHTAEGGGQELIAEGLKAAREELRWTQGLRKVAILMGDEQAETEEYQARCLLEARLFKEHGIVLHAVTASQTAWIYYLPPDAAGHPQWIEMTPEEKRTFRLPYFDAIAESGGGLSVSSWNSRELVLRLLAFGLGANPAETEAQVKIGAFFEWSKQREQAEAGAGPRAGAELDRGRARPLWAWVKHGGDWQAPRRWDRVFEYLAPRVALAGAPRVPVVDLHDEDASPYPILYVTGHGAVKWEPVELARLKAHLSAGGFLLADACCGDAEFSRSLGEHLARMFPGRSLEPLEPGHPLFSCGHRIENVRRSEKAVSGQVQTVPPRLLGLVLPAGEGRGGSGRLAVVLSPYGLGCAWRPRPLGPPCQLEESSGLALTANIFLWALTR